MTFAVVGGADMAAGPSAGDAVAQEEARIELECTPMAIARRLGKKPYGWQDKVMANVMPKGSRTALRAANESGKTSIILMAVVLWHLLVFTNGTVVITSGSWRQVKEQVFAALQKQADAFPGFVFLENEIIAPNGNRAIGFSTDDPNKFEGWHAEDHETGPLLVIVDEAKGVSDKIHEAISRCKPTRVLEMSSPGPAAGAFYRSFTTEREGWNHHVVTAFDCPHIDRASIERDIAQYGIDHPLIRSMIFAEWMLNGDTEQFVFPDVKFEAAMKSPPQAQDGDVEAFCDFAVSPEGDECVLAIRRGNQVEIVDAWRGCGDTIREAYRFVTLFRKCKLTEDQIAGDVSGMGAGYCDELATMGFNIQRINNGDAAFQPKRYGNLGTEIWFEACAKIERGEILVPWTNERFRKQLTTRKFEPTLKGQVQLLSKKKQGGESPDQADAVVGCCRKFNRQTEAVDMFRPDRLGSLNEEQNGLGADDSSGPSWMRSTI